jgi:hypothetical protein
MEAVSFKFSKKRLTAGLHASAEPVHIETSSPANAAHEACDLVVRTAIFYTEARRITPVGSENTYVVVHESTALECASGRKAAILKLTDGCSA